MMVLHGLSTEKKGIKLVYPSKMVVEQRLNMFKSLERAVCRKKFGMGLQQLLNMNLLINVNVAE